MDTADPTLIGSHCQDPYCNQLDFLPFRCESCFGTFCLDHRSETAHKCPKAGDWARRRAAATAASSTSSGRTTLAVDTPKPCASPASPAEGGPRLQEPGADWGAACALRYHGDYRESEAGVWAAESVGVGAEDRGGEGDNEGAAEAEAVEYGGKAGGGEYSEEEREGGREGPGGEEGGEFFYSRDWVVGRVLDAAAKSLQVQNVNNQSEDEREKLRVFHVEGGRLLEFGEKVGAALVSGNTIVLLRGVGPAIPNLIEA
ncbi:hypothetical protein V502_06019 [Pseudogymnoascus sp. VKM F-4520 (FW-2644)]|nr:hypothetical protein V502_06019 [Pseudogymnoascus sp. VKM F-4520 (FW-2644)]